MTLTRTTKAQRRRRYRMARAYLDRRENAGPWGGTRAHVAYTAWVNAFPKFMNIAYPGKLLTKQRVGIVRNYVLSRLYYRAPTFHCYEFHAWVADFERFMLQGYGYANDGGRMAKRRDVAHETPHLEKPTVAHASRPDRPTAQVD